MGINTTNSIVQAGRVTDVEKLVGLSENYFPEGEVFSLFLVPKSGSSVDLGDVVVLQAMLPHTNNKYVDVPVVVGDWSPVVFRAIQSEAADLANLIGKQMRFDDSEDYSVGDVAVFGSDPDFTIKRFTADWDHAGAVNPITVTEPVPFLDLTSVDAYVGKIKDFEI